MNVPSAYELRQLRARSSLPLRLQKFDLIQTIKGSSLRISQHARTIPCRAFFTKIQAFELSVFSSRDSSRSHRLQSGGYIGPVSEYEPSPLLDELPDLVIEVCRDGRILRYGGGRGVSRLVPKSDATGNYIDSIWSPTLAALVKRLVRKAIAARSPIETLFDEANIGYEVRIQAQSPTRALCVFRAEACESQDGDTRNLHPPRVDRRGFLRHFQANLSKCVIAETSAAVVIIHLDGLSDIARLFDTSLSGQIVATAIRRFDAQCGALGELDDGILGIVLHTADRLAIETHVAGVCKSLRRPVGIENSSFHLTPYAGVAILGQDAGTAQSLIDHARAAAMEAQRDGSSVAHFFSDTMKLRALARLDTARELHDAIFDGGIGVRYVCRHELSTGHLVALVSYAQWKHALRGEVPPAEFLSIAETSGSAVALSRAMLLSLQKDVAKTLEGVDAGVVISYGPLRHHVFHDTFVDDIEQFLSFAALPAGRFELRIAEKTFVILHPAVCERLHRLGVRLVVDEVGRGMASFDRLAQAPLWGLQLDRLWVEAIRSDKVALKVCRVGITAAVALGLNPIATGVDDEEQRLALLALGCTYGTGDLYTNTSIDGAGRRSIGG